MRFKLLAFSLLAILSTASFAEDTDSNLTSSSPEIGNKQKIIRMPERYPTPEEIERYKSIHSPSEWRTEVPVKRQVHVPKHRNQNITVRQVPQAQTLEERLLAHRASTEQIKQVKKDYEYDLRYYSSLPKEIQKILLVGKIHNGVGPLRIYRTAQGKSYADAYFASHQTHSEVLSAYLARKITLNNGLLGSDVTLYKVFVEELTYDFSNTPVLSVNSPKEAEEKYLYILIRLTPADRIQFWKYINTVRKGDKVLLPKDLTIADVLSARI
ncbi:TPA: hypothetical protein ACGIK9_002866 [Acinetobacter baumannii]|uniref:hypothetical protein n=1 Tax=Acinetobacter baumannii TaxID=470 RepID=UPI00338DE96A